jgi:hypothetical protein
MASEDVQKMILHKLENLELKVDTMIREGCAKAPGHALALNQQDGMFKRIRELEISQAEGKGKLVIVVAIITVIISAFITWLGKHF